MVMECPHCFAKYAIPSHPGEHRFGRCATCHRVFVLGEATLSHGPEAGLPPGEIVAGDRAMLERTRDSTTELNRRDFPHLGNPNHTEHREPGPDDQPMLALGDRVLRVDRLRMTLGRRDADVVLDDPDVSRLHAVIERNESGVVLTDLRSTNGTYVNDAKVAVAVLNHGDVIRLGATEIRYYVRPGDSVL
ncbi:MAG: FHA domain-containing protein [Acidobacteriota bacterium]